MSDEAPTIGHNSGFAASQLVSFVERIERLNEEKAVLQSDITEVYAEVKGQGYSIKVVRQLIVLRKLETADRQEREAILDLYMSALGMHR